MASKPRVLIFYDFFLPAYQAGGPIVSVANIVRCLHQRYDFYIVCQNGDLDLDGPLPDVVPDRWTDFEGVAQVYYFTPSKMTKEAVAALIDEIDPQTVYVNGLYTPLTVQLPLRILRKAQTARRLVVAPRGMLQEGALSVKKWKKRSYFSLVKLLGWFHKGVVWHATSEQEAADVHREFGKQANVQIATPIPGKHPFIEPLHHQERLKLATVSVMTEKKNVLAGIEALQTLDLPIDYDIYGPIKDLEYWIKCQEAIERVKAPVKVAYKGSLPPAALESTLSTYHGFLLPTLGENFGHAIYEALACGKPVLVGEDTPWRSVGEQGAGWAFAPRDRKAIAEAIRSLYAMLPADYRQSCRNARRIAVEYFETADFDARYAALFG